MDKRLQKRHQRHVLRARERVQLSEPDVRTPEQVQAAREASRPPGGWRHRPNAQFSTPPVRKPEAPAEDNPAKAGT